MDTQVNSTKSSHTPIQNEELYLASSKFASCDELLTSVREFYFAKGYGVSIRNSKKDKFVILQCDRGGSYRDVNGIADKRKRVTGSRLLNCTFRIDGKRGSDGVWVFKPKDLTHNHEPSSDVSGHPSFRRLPPDNIQRVKDMTMAGIPPRQILCSLRQQNPNLPATSRTIYNLKAKISKETLGNRSKVCALFEELKKGGFWYDILHDQQGHITSLFIAHPLSIKLAKVFSNVFVMDCTYKTNIYKMPLLDIIGVSCFNTSFYSGFAFLEREDEQSYIWALSAFQKILGHENLPSVIMSDRELALINAIKKVFPTTTSLLCVWHIEKNVLAHCKKYFEIGEEFDMFMLCWKNVVFSTTEAIFETNWCEIESFYNDKKDAIEYIKNIWLPLKEKFVSAWTDKYLHLGTRSSSRAEGAHVKLKSYLQVSTGGFLEVKDKICLAVEHEFNEIKVQLATERIKVPHNCNLPIFRELLTSVSHFALQKIYPQYEKVIKGTMIPCTGQFTATMGLPCAHKIENSQGITLSLDLIHPHWRIDILSLNANDGPDNNVGEHFDSLLHELRSKFQGWPHNKKEFATSMITKLVNETDIFFEPEIRRPKGRPPKAKKKKGLTSTAREPSRFEHVESSQTKKSSTSSALYQGNEVNKNNLIDLNVYPDFSADSMSLQ